LAQRSLPVLRRLAENVNLTVDLAVIDGDQALYIQKCPAPGQLELDVYVGKRTNLHCTAVGKMLLAHMPEELLKNYLARRVFIRHTAKTLTLPAELWKELECCRKQGYALDDEEEEMGVRCLAVPVFSDFGQIVAALGMVGTVSQVRTENMPFLIKLLRRAAGRISQAPPWKADALSNSPIRRAS
jgi:DNA-binding IclR family transcriptional regulator